MAFRGDSLRILGVVGIGGLGGALIVAGCAGNDGASGINGTNGLNALSRSTPEPAGANYPAGGQKTKFGLDKNGDGKLADSEVTGSAYLCAASGALAVTEPIAAGSADCLQGGVRLDRSHGLLLG